MAVVEALAYFMVAASLVSVLIARDHTSMEQIGLGAMTGAIVTAGLDSMIVGFPPNITVPVMIVGLAIAIATFVIDRMSRPNVAPE